jgi:vacuolar protein sorting-associated protein 8
MIIEEPTMKVTEKFDLIPKHILHQDYFSRQLRSLVGRMDEEGSLHASVANAFFNSVKTFKGRIFLLVCKYLLSSKVHALIEIGSL